MNEATQTKSDALSIGANDHPLNIAHEASSQLLAMLVMISGEGFDVLDNLRDDFKSNYIWACMAKAEQLHDVIQKLIPAQVTIHRSA